MNCLFNELPKNLLLQIINSNIKFKCITDVLEISEYDSRMEKFTEEEIKLLKLKAARFSSISFCSVKELLLNPMKWRRISFGCKNLDSCSRGGILTRGITEIYGESGSGKSQISLQLLLMIQLPVKYGGLEKEAVFISTEGPFQSRRISQMINYFNSKYLCEINYLNNIFVEKVLELDAFLDCILNRLPKLMKFRNIGLIIIDSIASVFRAETNYFDRSQTFKKIMSTFHSLVDKYECGVVCINQISWNIEQHENEASLGKNWERSIRTSFQISKCLEAVGLRKFEISFSPDCGYKQCKFMITSEGVTDAPD